MMSVLFNATEVIMDVLSEALAKYLLGEEELFEQKLQFTLRKGEGRWGHRLKGEKLYLAYDSPHLSFTPEIPVHTNIHSIMRAVKLNGKSEPVPTVDRVHLSAREVASDSLFSQIKRMLDMLEKRGGGSGGSS